MRIINGIAPCVKCGKIIDNIPLNADTRESDGAGGFWYDVSGKANCLECGESLRYFHIPALADELFFNDHKEAVANEAVLVADAIE